MRPSWFLLSSAAALTSWSLHGFWPQKTADILAYVASCALIGSAYHSSRFEILSRVAAILLAAAFLYVSCSTISFDSMQYTETRLTPSLSLRQTYDGWVGGEWVLLRIVYRPSWFPLVEHVLSTQRIIMSGNCDEHNIAVSTDLALHQVTVLCSVTSPQLLATFHYQ